MPLLVVAFACCVSPTFGQNAVLWDCSAAEVWSWHNNVDFRYQGRPQHHGQPGQNLDITGNQSNLKDRSRKPLDGFVIFEFGNWNDEANCVVVRPGYEVILYADTNYKGKSITLRSHRSHWAYHDLRKLGWGEKASSIKVRRTR